MSHLVVWSPTGLAPSWLGVWAELGHTAQVRSELGRARHDAADVLALVAADLGLATAETFRKLSLDEVIARVVVLDATPLQVAQLASQPCTALAGPLTDEAICASLAAMGQVPASGTETWVVGEAQVRVGLREVHRHGQVFPLSEQEAELLTVLWNAEGNVVSRDVLYRKVWGYRSRPQGRAVDFAIFRLRSKIERTPSSPESLLTVRGAGFRLLRSVVPAALPAPSMTLSLPLEPSTPYIGRRDELARIQQHVGQGARLITLAGQGGAGKTRLSLRVAAREVEGGDWPGGIGFVDLADAFEAAGACRAVAEALGLSVAPGLNEDQAVAQIGEACGGRGRTLLVLDNCEQVIAPLRRLVAMWMATSPDLVLLCTSRISLGLADEVLVDVGPLPDAQAARLLVDRARAVRPGFSSAADDVHVLDVVRGLGCLPLAIELAGSCLRLLSLGQIKARLDRQLDLLRGGAERPERHATLRATLDWSWDLLTHEHRQALARVSVFCGAFDLEAAAAVLANGDDLIAIEQLATLVDHHLVSFVDGVQTPQFALLPSVRAYGLERLQGWPELDGQARAEHARWFSAYGGDRGVPELDGPHAEATARRLGAGYDNLLAGLTWAITHNDIESALGCYSALEAYASYVGGPIERTVETAEALLVMPLAPIQRARALWHRAAVFMMTQEFERCLERLDEAIDLAAGADRTFLAWLHFRRGIAHRSLSRMDASLADLNRAVELGDGAVVAARAMQEMGIRLLVLGQLDEAIATSLQALEMARRLNAPPLQTRLMASLSEMMRKQGRLAEAWQYNSSAMEICTQTGNEALRGALLGNRGGISWIAGRLEEAEQILRESLRVHRRAGDRRNAAVVSVRLAWVLVFAGKDGVEVDSLGTTGVESARSVGNLLLHGVMRGSWAELQLFRGAPDQARTVLTGASDELAALGVPLVSFMSWCTWAGASAQVGARDEAIEAIDTAWALVEQVQSPLTLAMSLARLADAALRVDDPRLAQIWARVQASAQAMSGHPAVQRLMGELEGKAGLA